MTMDTLWINDPVVLLDKPFDFYPSNKDSFNTKMNALMRLSVYISVVLIIYYSNAKPLLMVLTTGIITVYLSKQKEPLVNTKDKFEEESKTNTVPTKDNPMMNFTVADLLNTDEKGSINPKLPIIDPLIPENAKEITDKSHQDMYRDVTDVFDKKLTDRQFYTMPITNEIDDRETWQKWCYNTPASCKEDSICYKYEDLRANRPEFPIPKEVTKL
jgi:hypothetical protein